jgi:hypothetical protein
MADGSVAPIQWAKRERASGVVAEQPRYSCHAFNGNPVVKSVCARVSAERAGNREYCVAHNCQSPWRVALTPCSDVPVQPAPVITPAPGPATAPLVVAPTPIAIPVPQPTIMEVPPEPEKPKVVIGRGKVLQGMDDRGRKNIAVLEEASASLRKQKSQIRVCELIETAALALGMSQSGLRAFYARSIPEETKKRWLYGEGGKKVTRADEKFAILARVRGEMRQRGEPSPTKRHLATAAAKLLGMTQLSAEGYIYNRLKPSQARALQFAGIDEQIAVLKRVRQEMREKGLPAPQQTDLATAAAPLLGIRAASVRSLIAGLSQTVLGELEFMGSRACVIAGLDQETVRNGFIGAIAVLRLRKMHLTTLNLRLVLKLRPAVIESYVAENPDIKMFME